MFPFWNWSPFHFDLVYELLCIWDKEKHANPYILYCPCLANICAQVNNKKHKHNPVQKLVSSLKMLASQMRKNSKQYWERQVLMTIKVSCGLYDKRCSFVDTTTWALNSVQVHIQMISHNFVSRRMKIDQFFFSSF